MRILLTICCSFVVAIHSRAGEPRTNTLLEPVPATAQLLIPAAGSVEGANGTFFRSDIMVRNFRDVVQRVELRWLPQAGAAGAAPVFVDIPVRSSIGSEDFVGEILHQTGLGSIVVTGVTAGGATDVAARLTAASRIWTPQPGTTGTTSQSLPAVPMATIGGAEHATIIGVRRDARYRVNVGIVNVDPVRTQTLRVEVPTSLLSLPPEVYEVTVPPLSMQLIALNALLRQPLSEVRVSNESAAAVRSSSWIAFASSVDNVTGDAWSELAGKDPF
jgi:hypothetical protein